MTNSESRSSAKSAVTGAIIGAAAGVAAGILLAPKSGQETRAQIKNTANNIKNKAGQKVELIKREAKNKLGEVADKTKLAVSEGAKAAQDT